MKTIYIDADFKCYLEDAEGRTAIETSVFDDIAPAVIEGYRYVPDGQSWTREDGTVFTGEMVAPWKDSRELEALQRDYERQKLAEYESALKTLGVQTE